MKVTAGGLQAGEPVSARILGDSCLLGGAGRKGSGLAQGAHMEPCCARHRGGTRSYFPGPLTEWLTATVYCPTARGLQTGPSGLKSGRRPGRGESVLAISGFLRLAGPPLGSQRVASPDLSLPRLRTPCSHLACLGSLPLSETLSHICRVPFAMSGDTFVGLRIRKWTFWVSFCLAHRFFFNIT